MGRKQPAKSKLKEVEIIAQQAELAELEQKRAAVAAELRQVEEQVCASWGACGGQGRRQVV